MILFALGFTTGTILTLVTIAIIQVFKDNFKEMLWIDLIYLIIGTTRSL